MIFQVLFTVLFFSALIYASIFGGREGKTVSLILMISALLTIPASFLTWNSSFLSWPLFMLDLLCFIALYYVASNTQKLWPLWLAGLQLSSVACHIAVIIAPESLALIYDAISRFWSIPMLLLMVIGIRMDRNSQKLK